MPARVWLALTGATVLLLAAVVGLDRWQVRQGEPSVLSLLWPPRAVVSPPGPPALPAPPRPPTGARIAVIVDGLGGRRDVFEALRSIGAPVAVAVLPGLPLSAAIGREARQAGMELLLDLPLEPYRYPEADPGPGALLMTTAPERLGREVAAHLAVLPGAAGVTTHMGSRMSEDRARMRAVLEPVAARGLYFLDAFTSNRSVGYAEAARLGMRAGRRQLLIDPGGGEAAARSGLEAASRLALARGRCVVLAHAHPLTAALLHESVSRWRAAGLRVAPPSEVIDGGGERTAS